MMSAESQKLPLFIADCSRGNILRSRPRDYGGRSNVVTLFLAKKSLTKTDRCAVAWSWRKNQLFVLHLLENFLLTVSVSLRRMSMHISLFRVTIFVNYTSEFQEYFEATTLIHTHVCTVFSFFGLSNHLCILKVLLPHRFKIKLIPDLRLLSPTSKCFSSHPLPKQNHHAYFPHILDSWTGSSSVGQNQDWRPATQQTQTVIFNLIDFIYTTWQKHKKILLETNWSDFVTSWRVRICSPGLKSIQ